MRIRALTLLEANVHHQLRRFLREKQQPLWSHHLTMARLVSRTLRLQRSTLIQTGRPILCYCYSYLTPALLSDQSIILVVPTAFHKRLFEEEIPQLQKWLGTNKPIISADQHFSSDNLGGLWIISPERWLSDRLLTSQTVFPPFPTLIEQAENLADWTTQILTFRLTFQDWQEISQFYEDALNDIREIRVKLTQSFFSHPPNPYHCYLLDENDLFLLEQLKQIVEDKIHLIPFFQQWKQENRLYWVKIQRQTGHFTLQSSPLEVASYLTPIWQQQPIVLMGSFLDQEKEAQRYQNRLGLQQKDLLCLKFTPHRQNEYISLYLPDKLPLPNTPEFQGILQAQINHLLKICQASNQPIVILIEDVPLQAQVGSYLAAQWGTRVQVNRISTENNTILVCCRNFWQQHQTHFPVPRLLIMATLPIPSLENPRVAGQVAYYKQKRMDWFRSYLLPTAISHLQRAVMPLRETQGLVAILDNRVNNRSYGSTILTALDPYVRMNYLDENSFS